MDVRRMLRCVFWAFNFCITWAKIIIQHIDDCSLSIKCRASRQTKHLVADLSLCRAIHAIQCRSYEDELFNGPYLKLFFHENNFDEVFVVPCSWIIPRKQKYQLVGFELKLIVTMLLLMMSIALGTLSTTHFEMKSSWRKKPSFKAIHLGQSGSCSILTSFHSFFTSNALSWKQKSYLMAS